MASPLSLPLRVAVTLWSVVRRKQNGRSTATQAASRHGRTTRAPSQSSSLPETEEKCQGVQALTLPSASEGRGLTGCGKTRLACHSEESRSDRDDVESRPALKILRARFLAPLGMTAWRGFSAACLTPRQAAQQRESANYLFSHSSGGVPDAGDMFHPRPSDALPHVSRQPLNSLRFCCRAKLPATPHCPIVFHP